MNFTPFLRKYNVIIFNDINLSQDILTNFINSPSIINHTLHSNAITPTSPKTINTQSLPFFDPSFFAHRKAFDNFFLPSDTFLTLPILLQAQKDDPVLSTVYTWLKQKQRPHYLTPIIKANSFLYTYYTQFQHLYIDPNSHLIQYYTPNSRIFEEIFIKTQPSINQTRICLPFKLFYAAFSKTHSHGHSAEKLSIKTFTQFYFIPHLPLWFSIFIHDCIDCQTNKHFPIKPQNISPPLPFYESATHFNYRISMDTKGPISPSSQNNCYIFVIIDAFSHFVVTNPAPNITSKYALQTLLHHGSQSLVPLSILLQIEVLNILIKTWLISVLSFILTIHLELLIHHGPTVWSKSKTEILQLISGYFYKTILLIGHFKLKCMHMLITQHLFPSLNFLHTRLFSIPILAYLSPFPLIYLEMLKKLYCNLLRISFSSFTL